MKTFKSLKNIKILYLSYFPRLKLIDFLLYTLLRIFSEYFIIICIIIITSLIRRLVELLYLPSKIRFNKLLLLSTIILS